MADWLADRLLGAPARVRLTRTMLLAAAVVVITWILAVREDVYAWEIDVTEWVLDLPSWTEPVLRASMQSGNRLAVAALALLFLIVDRPRRAAVVLLAGWGAWLACVGAKAVVGRPRPTADVLGFSPEEFAGGNGYPSSHTAVAVALALVIVTTTGVPRVLKGAAVVLAVLTGVARLYLAVHWPLDVIGGAALAIVVAAVVVAAVNPAPIPEAWLGAGRWPPPEPETTTGLAARPAGDEPFTVRVGTFNIRNGRAWDGRDAWPFRRRRVRDAIEALDADLVGLQEVYGSQRRWLARRMRSWSWIGLGRTDGHGRGEQCPILWRSDVLELETWGVRWLSDEPERPGSRYPNSVHPRIVTVGRFLHRPSGRRCCVLNAHLDASDHGNRVLSAELIADWVESEDGVAWIVLGDLNARPDSEPLAVLAGRGLVRAEPSEDCGTHHGFRGGTDGPRIDHVLTTEELRVVDARVGVVVDGRPASDHWPVVADVAAAEVMAP